MNCLRISYPLNTEDIPLVIQQAHPCRALPSDISKIEK